MVFGVGRRAGIGARVAARHEGSCVAHDLGATRLRRGRAGVRRAHAVGPVVGAPAGLGVRAHRRARDGRCRARLRSHGGAYAANAHGRGARRSVPARDENRRRLVSRGARARHRSAGRCADARVGAAASGSLGGARRAVANRVGRSGRDRGRRRAPGPARAERRPVRRTGGGVQLAGGSTHLREPGAVTRQHRISGPYVGAVRDVDVAGRVRRGERASARRARSRAGARDVRRRRERRVRVLARREVRRPLGSNADHERRDDAVGGLRARRGLGVRATSPSCSCGASRWSPTPRSSRRR